MRILIPLFLILAFIIPDAKAQTYVSDGEGSLFEPEFTEVRLETLGVHATVCIPTSGQKRHPSVLFIGGNSSGREDRDCRYGDATPFRDMAEALASEGYVTMRFDPTPSQAEGVRPMLSLLQADASAALSLLRSLPYVSCVGTILIGHDTGAYTAFNLAAGHPASVKAIVALSAPLLPGRELLAELSARSFDARGEMVNESYSTAAGNLYTAVAEAYNPDAPDSVSPAARRKIVKALGDNAEDLRMTSVSLEETREALTQPSMIEYAATDFGAPLSKVTCPVIAIYGSRSPFADPKTNIPRLRSLHPSAQAHIIPGALITDSRAILRFLQPLLSLPKKQ